MPGLPVQRVLHHQLFFSFQGFVQGLQDSRLWRKGIIRMSMIVIVFWLGVIWERARMGLDNITFLWLLPFPLPEYNPSQIWPSPLNCQHHTIFYVTYTNRMEKTKYLAKFLKFFLCEPVYRVIFWLVPPKSFKCSQLKKGKFELKLPIFSVRYLCQGVTKSYKLWDERQKINTETNIDRKITKITRHGLYPSQIQVWKFLGPNSTPIMVKIAYMC